jgi:hypothetical protein
MLGLGLWIEVKDGDPRAVGIYRRHYSAKNKNHGLPIDYCRYGFSGKGESMVLLAENCNALFCWRKVEGEGIQCTVFRNESDLLSSDLIKEADNLAFSRWPEKRHYTYVNAGKIKSSNPGYCFIKAGWHRCGLTQKGLVILEGLRDGSAGSP